VRKGFNRFLTLCLRKINRRGCEHIAKGNKEGEKERDRKPLSNLIAYHLFLSLSSILLFFVRLLTHSIVSRTKTRITLCSLEMQSLTYTHTYSTEHEPLVDSAQRIFVRMYFKFQFSRKLQLVCIKRWERDKLNTHIAHNPLVPFYFLSVSLSLSLSPSLHVTLSLSLFHYFCLIFKRNELTKQASDKIKARRKTNHKRIVNEQFLVPNAHLPTFSLSHSFLLFLSLQHQIK